MKILVTGASGFLGRHVVERLQADSHEVHGIGCHNPPGSFTSSFTDLTDGSTARVVIREAVADAVIHLAGVVGGIGRNQKEPGRMWHDNLLMGLNVLEACRLAEVPKLIMVGSVCAYPYTPPVPFLEQDIFNGLPEPTNAPYGIAKRALLMGAIAYRRQYTMNVISVIPTNLYGPGAGADLETSHFVPALIRKFHEAKEHKAIPHIWGSGNATRDLLYVEDCAEALARVLTMYDGAAPINLGTGMEYSVAEVAAIIAEIVGYQGPTYFDNQKPDGQPRRRVDTCASLKAIGHYAKMTLREGLEKTYAWYLTQPWSAKYRQQDATTWTAT